MKAANKIFKFSRVKNSYCDVIVNMEMCSFAKFFIKIIDNSQTKQVSDLKILLDLEHHLIVKISIFLQVFTMFLRFFFFFFRFYNVFTMTFLQCFYVFTMFLRRFFVFTMTRRFYLTFLQFFFFFVFTMTLIA